MNDIYNYILHFLLYGNDEAAQYVGYTADKSEWSKYKVVIIPSGHFGKDWVLPNMNSPHAQKLEGHETWIIDIDIIYNTLFFISRAEELTNKERDEHGRFAARFSILGQHNRLLIPLADEYGRLLVKLLELPVISPEFSRICLTHDTDALTQYRSLRGTLGGLRRGEFRQTARAWQDLTFDPVYTFPWLVKQDAAIENAQSFYFIKLTGGKGFDSPQYGFRNSDYQAFRRLLLDSGAVMGLHSSYYGKLPAAVPAASGIDIRFHRSHYLRCSIEQMQRLCEAGITDDFTMGFADMAGFRLQTCRPVRWINPETMQLTQLTLHPLTVMDGTLSQANYMNLNEDEAYFLCQRLFDKVRQNNGELCLLWHNTSVMGEGSNLPASTRSYHRSLYPKLLSLLL